MLEFYGANCIYIYTYIYSRVADGGHIKLVTVKLGQLEEDQGGNFENGENAGKCPLFQAFGKQRFEMVLGSILAGCLLTIKSCVLTGNTEGR